MIDEIVLVVNKCGEEIAEYAGKKRYLVPPDGGLYPMPKHIAMRYLRRGVIDIVSDVEKYMQDNPGTMMRHLIVRDGGIGDLILLAPCLAQFKRTHQGVTLAVACAESNIPIVEAMPYVDEVHAIGSPAANAYIWRDDLRAYSETADSRTRKHRTDVYAEKVQGCDCDFEKRPRIQPLKYKLPFDPKNDLPIVVIQCGSSHVYRDWPHTMECARILADVAQVVLIHYKDDLSAPVHENIVDLRCRLDVADMASVIAQSDLFIGPDSGGMHIALACGVPTIGIFGIIRPDFRVRYYDTSRSYFFDMTEKCPKPHCGEYHMDKCGEGTPYAGCMQRVTAQAVADKALELAGKPHGNVTATPATKRAERVAQKVQTAQVSASKLTLCCISQNEAHNAPIFIERVMKNKHIGRVIIIDGGSTDGSDELFRKAGAEVYTHPYLKEYHEMQAMQRNISCSYLHEDERCLIMDMDECFGPELEKNLAWFATTRDRYVEIPRRTYKTLADALADKGRIKDYPDWQPRFFIWSHNYKWHRSPHHIILNAPKPARVPGWDILHYEEEGKDRAELEAKWKSMQKKSEVYHK